MIAETQTKPTRTLTTTDGKLTVESSLTTAEVVELLKQSKASFARKLLAKRQAYGAWTPNQNVWAHKLAIEQRDGKKTDTPENRKIDGFGRVFEMFERAAAKLKYPKIVFAFDDQPITLYRSGPRARKPGSIQVTDGGKYGNNKWYGVIDHDGTFRPSRTCPDDVIEFLKLFAADPAGIAAAYGHSEGQCVFCRSRLADPRSVTVGFGPTCAQNYGLANEWKTALKQKEQTDG